MGKKNSEILEFLEANYLPAIKTAEDDKGLNEVLFKTVNYLMEHTYNLTCGILGACNEREKKKIFSSFGKQAAQKACDFYQASKGQLDPEALNEETWRKLETAVKQINEVNASLESLEKNNADLLQKENELNEKKETYEKLNKKVSALKEIKEKVTIEALNKIKQDAEELDLHLGENSKIVIKLKEYGITSVEKFLNEIDRRKDIVKNEIKWFDNILKDIISAQEGRDES
ncbi:MAG: hypothetical protein FWB77_01060 [Treponema sp.]|nr:hypothetical protein [Treponema sp.]